MEVNYCLSTPRGAKIVNDINKKKRPEAHASDLFDSLKKEMLASVVIWQCSDCLE